MNNKALINALLRLRKPGGGKQSLLIYAAIAALAIGGWYFKGPGGKGKGGGAPPVLPAEGIDGRCSKVVDGDTIEVLVGDKEKLIVRILGIDTMEPHNEDKRVLQAERLDTSVEHVLRMAKWASREMNTRALRKAVRLVFSQGGAKRDPYGRVLAYVEVDGVDLGAEMLKSGLAEARREVHDRTPDYRRLNDEARRNKRGIYGKPQI